MVNVEAKLSIKGKRFEILVDVDKALAFKGGKSVSMQNVLAVDKIFSDVKKGMQASEADLITVFNTKDINIVAQRIIQNGELQVPSEYKANERENKIKQVVDFLAKNAQDPATGKPHTPSRIQDAIKQAAINIDNRPIEEQMSGILSKLKVVIPIKIETKKLSIRIPVMHTGKAYGIVKEYMEKEEWLSNGDLQVTINIPVGMQMAFFDKLNGVTHGSAIVEEIKK